MYVLTTWYGQNSLYSALEQVVCQLAPCFGKGTSSRTERQIEVDEKVHFTPSSSRKGKGTWDPSIKLRALIQTVTYCTNFSGGGGGWRRSGRNGSSPLLYIPVIIFICDVSVFGISGKLISTFNNLVLQVVVHDPIFFQNPNHVFSRSEF
jgi:hypothetical protein